MSAFQQQYKVKRFGFGDTKKTRLLRSEIREQSRKSQRAKIFNENRNIPTLPDSTKNDLQSVPVNKDRLTRLMKWKIERERRKKMEKVQKKPPFVVGIVHHKIYSPMNNKQIKGKVTRKKGLSQTVPVSSVSPLKRVTRATQKRLLTKTLAKEAIKRSAENRKSISKERMLKKRQEQSFAPADYKFKAPEGLPHIPLFGRVVLESMSPGIFGGFLTSASKMSRIGRKSISGNVLKAGNDNIHNTTVTETPLSLKKNLSISKSNDSPNKSVLSSAHVISTCRKSNAKKAQQLKSELNISHAQNNDSSTKDISVKDENSNAQHFRFLLNREIDRLTQLCKKWTNIKDNVTTTENGQYEINQAIGQTNLLINKKFQRFSKLITDCESGKGDMLVTCKDLQGFWDMMYIEINDCNTRFEKLEKLCSQNWVEEQSPLPKIVPLNKKRNITKKKIVSTKPSSIRAFLAQKKKYITRQARNSSDTEQSVNENDSTVKAKTRRSSMLLGSKISTPVNQKKTRSSLFSQEALSSAKSKNIQSPLTMIKVSQMCKTLHVQLDNTTFHNNSDEVSGKRVLRQIKDSPKVKSSKTSVSKMNFNSRLILNRVSLQDILPKVHSDTTLTEIGNFNSDSSEEVKSNIGKKLNFDNSFEELENNKTQNSELNSVNKKLIKVSSIKTQAGISLNHLSSNKSLKSRNITDENNKQSDNNLMLNLNLTRLEESADDTHLNTPKQKLLKRDSVHEKEETTNDDKNIKILRNRIIASPNTKKRNSAKVEDKEEKNLWKSVDKISLNEKSDKRKSRRSVKFSESNVDDDILSKPTLSKTPYSRRSKSKSIDKKRSITTEDLTFWETPQQPPKRVKKSRSKKRESLI